ncbi:MAG: peptidase, partial [Halanaeroarchaeum sp.]
MSRSPILPDRPTLDLDPELTPEERLAALTSHYRDIVNVQQQLETQLDRIEEQRNHLREEVDRLQRENETLKTASLYLATVEDVFDEGEAVIKQHGNNQEVLTEVSQEMYEAVDMGDRVAINDSFAIQEVLDDETDARAQAMEVEASPGVTYEDIGGLADEMREVQEAVEDPLNN